MSGWGSERPAFAPVLTNRSETPTTKPPQDRRTGSAATTIAATERVSRIKSYL